MHTHALIFRLVWATNKDSSHAVAGMRWLLLFKPLSLRSVCQWNKRGVHEWIKELGMNTFKLFNGIGNQRQVKILLGYYNSSHNKSWTDRYLKFIGLRSHVWTKRKWKVTGFTINHIKSIIQQHNNVLNGLCFLCLRWKLLDLGIY